MNVLIRLCNIMIAVTVVVTTIALVLILSGAWLAYVPYINIAVGYANPIFWRCLGTLFWLVVIRWVFAKLGGGYEEDD